MSWLRRLKKNTAVTFFTNTGNQLLAFGSTVIFARVAGETALGQFYLFLSVYRLSSVATSMGIGKALVKRVSEYNNRPQKQRQLFTATITVDLAMVTVAGIILFFFSNKLDSYIGFEGVLPLLLIALLLAIIGGDYRNLLAGQKAISTVSIIDLSKNISTVLFQLVLIYLGFGAKGLVFGFLGGILISAVLSVAFSEIIMPVAPTVDEYTELFTFAKYSYLDNFVGGYEKWPDMLLLGYFAPASLVGIYGVAYSLSQFGVSISSAISKSIFPEVSTQSGNKETVSRDVLWKSVQYAPVLAIPLSVGALILGDEILLYIYSFDKGYLSLFVLSIGSIFYSAYQPMHQIIYGLDYPRVAFIIGLLSTLTNVGVTLLLVKQLGILGVAISTALALFVSFIAGAVFLTGKIGQPELYRVSAYQIGSAVLMGVVVQLMTELVTISSVVRVVLVVLFGASIYSLPLYVLNAGIELPVSLGKIQQKW